MNCFIDVGTENVSVIPIALLIYVDGSKAVELILWTRRNPSCMICDHYYLATTIGGSLEIMGKAIGL